VDAVAGKAVAAAVEDAVVVEDGVVVEDAAVAVDATVALAGKRESLRIYSGGFSLLPGLT
jgi:hypothetical protein